MQRIDFFDENFFSFFLQHSRKRFHFQDLLAVEGPRHIIHPRLHQELVIFGTILLDGINITKFHFTFYEIVQKGKIQLPAATAGGHFGNRPDKRIIDISYGVAQTDIGCRVIVKLAGILVTGQFDQTVPERDIRIILQRNEDTVWVQEAIFFQQDILGISTLLINCGFGRYGFGTDDAYHG